MMKGPWIKQKDSFWLVSLRDGSRKMLQMPEPTGYDMTFPDEDVYVFFSYDNYYSVDLKTGITRNISSYIPHRWLNSSTDQSNEPDSNFSIGIAGSIKGENSVLVYDDYDIWRLDLTGKKPAVNITMGYGRSHKIKI